MLKTFLLAPILFLIGFAACNPAIQSKEEIEYLNRKIEPSLAIYLDTLTKLSKDASATLEHAVRLYDTLVPDDSTAADSAATALIQFVNDVVKKENKRFLHDTSDYSGLIDPANYTLTEKQKAYQTKLFTDKMKFVSDGEGGAYLVPLYETILPSIKNKTSTPVDIYLDLVAKEDTTPVFLDAGLAIEMTELVDRLVISEQLLAQKLPQRFLAEATRLNRFYTHALVMGADNTSAIEYETNLLNEEFRKGYDYLIAKYPTTKAAANIKVWMAVVASGDRDKMDAYLKTMQ